MAFRNSPLRTVNFTAIGGGDTILPQLTGGTGPAVNYLVKIEMVEQIAGAGLLTDGSPSLSIDIPAAVAVGTRYEFSFGEGYRLAGNLIMDGAGTRGGTVTYYAGV